MMKNKILNKWDYEVEAEGKYESTFKKVNLELLKKFQEGVTITFFLAKKCAFQKSQKL